MLWCVIMQVHVDIVHWWMIRCWYTDRGARWFWYAAVCTPSTWCRCCSSGGWSFCVTPVKLGVDDCRWSCYQSAGSSAGTVSLLLCSWCLLKHAVTCWLEIPSLPLSHPCRRCKALWWACLYGFLHTCLSVCLHVSKTVVKTSPNFLCVCLVAVSWSFFDDNTVRFVLVL